MIKKFDLNVDNYKTTRDEIRREIRSRWKELFPPDGKGRGIICPLCGSGTGKNGTGISENPRNPGQLSCWKCGFKGDAIDLLQQQAETDYNGALQIAADDLGILLPVYRSDTPAEPRRATQSDPGSAAGKKDDSSQEPAQKPAAADYTEYYEKCRDNLDDPAALSYLQARGIHQDTAAAYNLGFDPAADPANVPGAMGNEYKPHPAPRLIMPVTKSFYIGRRTDGGKEYTKINAAGGGSGIFNAAAIGKPGALFVVEGIFDALSIIECGAAAIALNSTSNADLLIKWIESKRATAQFILCLDNDDAGRRASEKLQEAFSRLNIKYIVANICGDYKDANDALQADPAALKRNIDDAIAELLQDELAAFLDKIQTEAYKPYRTELPFFDDLLGGGVIRQTLLLLLAAPGTGKTTLCQQIAEAMAAHGKPVIYINLEMSNEQMLAKAISSRLARKGKKMTALEVMQGYSWTDEQRAAVIDCVNEYRAKIEPYLLYNPDGVGSDLDRIKEYLHSVGEMSKAAGDESPAIVLDYLHLISSRAGLDTQELIKQAVTMLKQYAIDYNTFAIGIVATNRESNKIGKITMESGRDSSNLEYTADYQLSLNYNEIDNGNVKPTDTEEIAKLQRMKWRQMIIRVLKGRFCMPGKYARVYFNAANNIFYGENDFIPADPERIPFDELKEENNAGNGQPVTARF